jgi:hypothetical protein
MMATHDTTNGMPVPLEKPCSTCDTKNPRDAEFCINCGAQFAETGATVRLREPAETPRIDDSAMLESHQDDAPKAWVPIVVYVYPKRNPEHYGRLVQIAPAKDNQAVIRLLLLLGWREVKDEVEKWIEKSGGADAHRRRRIDKTVLPPIPDLNTDTSVKETYRIYLNPANEQHAPLLKYLTELPSGRARQVFVSYAMVKALDRVEDIVKLLSS